MLDTVIALRKPPDYQADQGARFEIHFEKSRGFFGPEAEPFEVRLVGKLWQEFENQMKLEAHTTGKLVLVWCNHPDDFSAEKAKRLAAGTISENDDVRCVCWKVA